MGLMGQENHSFLDKRFSTWLTGVKLHVKYLKQSSETTQVQFFSKLNVSWLLGLQPRQGGMASFLPAFEDHFT